MEVVNAERVREVVSGSLRREGFDPPGNLPLTEIVGPRPSDEVARRIVQLYGLIGVSEPGVENQALREWIIRNGLWESLDKAEKDLFGTALKELPHDVRVRLGWMRESMLVLCWALELSDQLPDPEEQGKVDGLLELIPPAVDVADFVSKARERPVIQIAESLDRYYLLHWIVRERSFGRATAGPSVSPSVVTERARALEWVAGNGEWAAISLDT